MSEKTVRKANYAGSFYPLTQGELSADVDRYIDEVQLSDVSLNPKVLVCPHAGYIYSGPVVGYSYKVIQNLVRRGKAPRTVFLLGPSHQMAVEGLCVSDVDYWSTPLGTVPVSTITKNLIEKETVCSVNRVAHSREHSLEVQIPFLQRAFGSIQFEIVPIIMNEVDAQTASEVLTRYQENSLIVVSTDLSHYHSCESAKEIDKNTIDSVLALDAERLCLGGDACGLEALRIAITMAKSNNWKTRLLKYLSSGDTAGSRDAVVGYASLCFYED